MRKLTLSLGLLAALILATAWTTANAADIDEPKAIAHDTVNKLMEAMDGRRAELKKNPKALYDLVDEILVPLVDTDYMSQLVLGKYWRQADENQRERFKTAFKSMLIRTYGNALLEFDKDQIEYRPIRAKEDAEDITFKAIITTDSGDTVPVNLKLHLVDDQWKVYDGRVGNLSFVSNYRSQFGSFVRRNGVEKLIVQMEKKYGIH